MIQIDEPALREGLPLRKAAWPEYLEWAVDCFRLSAAGVAPRHLPMPGHIHTSLTAVGVIVTADPVREEAADFLATRLAAPVPATCGPPPGRGR